RRRRTGSSTTSRTPGPGPRRTASCWQTRRRSVVLRPTPDDAGSARDLQKSSQSPGCELRLRKSLESLIVDGGTVTGVNAVTAAGPEAPDAGAVVLASDGFQGNVTSTFAQPVVHRPRLRGCDERQRSNHALAR